MELGIPEQWNTSRVTPVFKKGDDTLAANYRPICVMGPLAKLYATCLNLELNTRHRPTAGWLQRRLSFGSTTG